MTNQNGSMTEMMGRARQVRLRDGVAVSVVEFGMPSSTAASLLFVPALGVPLSYYGPLLTQWCERGRHIVAVEQRGVSLSSVAQTRRATFGYSTIICDDLPAVIEEFFSTAQPFVAVGHSLGGQLALLATASGAITPCATVAIASGTSSPVAMNTVWGRLKRRGQVAFIRATSAVLGYWPGDRLGFGGRQPRSLMRDWCAEGRHGRYLLHGDGEDYEAALQALTQPVQMVTLHGDPVITEYAATHLVKRLPGHVNHRTISTPTGEPFDHIRWARSKPEVVIDAVEGWLEKVFIA